jgi:hypothetical protein
MKFLKTLFVTIALCGFAAPAAAQEMMNEDWLDKGLAFGIGADSTIGGGPGLSLRLFPIEQFGIELIFGGSSMTRSVERAPQAGDQFPPVKVRTGTSQIAFSLIPEFRFLTSNRASLSGYFGIGLLLNRVRTDFPESGTAFKATDSFADIQFEFGLRGEVFLYRYFSIFGRVGIRVDPYSDGENDFVSDPTALTDPRQPPPIDDPSTYGGADISIFNNGDLLGQFGFTVWFN